MVKLTKKKKPIAKTEKEKVEERREEVLANGRKFKYPLQYAKYKLVLITIAISTVALIALVAVGWASLYKWQDTGDITYRVTKVLPLAVAKVDNEDVKFFDYLMLYRSSITVVEQQSGQLGEGEDAEMLRKSYKRTALDNAENYTYALKLAKEKGITVSSDDVNTVFNEQRQVGGIDRSADSFLQVIENNFGLSEDEYRRLLYLSLTKAKVEEEIDQNANQIAGQIETMIASGTDFSEQLASFGDQIIYEATGGLVSNKNVDGGRSNMAKTLEPGAWSERFVSSNGDGYYFVKLIEKNDTQVNYISIKIPFTEFKNQMNKLREEGKITEYIDLSL